MTSNVLKDGFPSAHLTTRQWIESSIDLQKLFAAIDADPAIVGAEVVYLDAQLRAIVLREFQPICSVAPKKVILREAPSYVGRVEFARRLANEPRQSQVAFEAVNAALACTSAVISWVVIAGGFGLSPFTFGGSGVAAAISVVGASASSVQCIMGFQRTRYEYVDPARNDELDSNEWYQAVTIGLDAASLLSIGNTAMSTIRFVNMLKKATGKNTHQVLKGLNRQERVKLTKELLSINHPDMTRKMVKLKQMAGEMPRRHTSAEVRRGTIMQMLDAVGAVSGLAGSVRSGNIRIIAVGLYEEISE
ncbi:NAD synthetase [Pseudomonas sp. SH10-3B]|uniref:NAD synthetase n=1 Tax=Pseudomonas sp. SH10-3B TaxID=2816049 RepID=UPI001CA5FE12|nr:NAD synthetase [Pseudomonas sp. SH10-3B]MBY8946394.1 NAD synthetase [Pseudomonas sp. SH10-3B]